MYFSIHRRFKEKHGMADIPEGIQGRGGPLADR
jgi:hypothetical protein